MDGIFALGTEDTLIKTGPKLPSKKNWRTYRRWRGWPEPPEADYTLDIRRLYDKAEKKKRP